MIDKKYFKVGDIVINPLIWGKRLFQIYKFTGNSYLSEACVHEYGKSKINSNECNFNISEIKLYDNNKRPLKKLKKDVLVKLIKKGNMEAKREFLIRLNKK